MRSFLDSNVVVYAFDGADPSKQRRALEILADGQRLVLSTQVLLETWWVLTRRLARPLAEAAAEAVLQQLCRLPVVGADSELVLRAVRISRSHRVAIWDAMILEAARSAGCSRVLSEDLQHGRDFDGLQVVNPFLEGA
jgi:predicted nucleic acid-binding protein